MPERDVSETIKRLTPMLNDPNLSTWIEEAATKASPVSKTDADNEDTSMMAEKPEKLGAKPGKGNGKKAFDAMQNSAGNNSMLAQVVGIIIGSPEFQRK